MEEEARQHNKSTWLSRITAVVLIALLLTFFVVTLRNMTTISQQVESVKDGPYPVSVAAGRVETLLVQLRTVAERPAYLNTYEAAVDVRESYDSVDADMTEKLAYIAEHHTLSPDDAHALQDGYNELVARQNTFVAMCADGSIGDEAVQDYAERELFPLIEHLLTLDLGILDESTAQVEEMYTTVNTAIWQMVLVSGILMTAVVVSLVLYLLMLHRKSQSEKMLRASLQDALVLAQSANAAKSAFLSNMSHDIRTPMNAIVGLTSIASAHLDDPHRVKECLTRISTSSKHLLGLINDVLDMGKIESGKITLNEERFSFPDLISEFITVVQPQARGKRLNFDVVIGNTSHEMLVGDTMRLNQILLNLVSNAIKYTNEGDTVRIAISEEPGGRSGYSNYRFVVEDTGIGMDQEFLAHIFDPFERERNETTKFTEGTGLGMSITKNVVDLMGGTINVTSEPGVGSCFNVVIPLKHAPGSQETLDLTGFDALRVLVVDDDTDVLENTMLIFKEFGTRSEAASSGLDAVALTITAHGQHDDFNAIIVDWVMPEIDGIETIRRIRAEVGDATPIVLLTAYDWTEIEEEAKAAGVSAFITKPLFKSRLHQVLKTLCIDRHAEGDKSHKQKQRSVSGRVLLVEDNELNREIACELIRSLGADVETACDGLEAVEKIKSAEEGYYQLVFMDWQMPRMDGIEATKCIIAHERESNRFHVPIVAMTANAFNEDRELALAAGMDGFMTKPIDLDELASNVRMFLS